MFVSCFIDGFQFVSLTIRNTRTHQLISDSMITACIVLLYLSYAIPVICLLIRGRSNIKHGPFWLGPIGLFSNIVLLVWTLFTLIMYSFPYAKPVAASNMNCKSANSFTIDITLLMPFTDVCVVYAVVATLTGLDWVFRGRKSFRGIDKRKADISAHGHAIVDVPGQIKVA
jgi:choline transport protein